MGSRWDSILWKSKITLLFMIAVMLPFGGKIMGVLIGLLLVTRLLRGRFADSFKSIGWGKETLLFIGFYLLYVFGMLYSSNYVYGGKDLETKLSMLIFPLIFMDLNAGQLPYTKIFLAYVGSCLIAFLMCIGMVYYHQGGGEFNNFFYSNLSKFLHPGYFSMYISLAICMLFFVIRTSVNLNFWKATFLKVLIPVFVVAQIFLASKSGILVTLFVFVLIGIHYIRATKKVAKGLFVFFLSTALLIGLAVNVPYFKNRFETLLNLSTTKKIDNTAVESSAVRIIIWKAALEIVQQHPLLGVGTGDVKDALMKKYKEKGMTGAYGKELNAHNQFIQTLVTLGFLGLMLFLASLIFPFVTSVKHENYLYCLFLIIVFANFLTESILETQAGVIFYAFFNALLPGLYKKKC